MNKKLLLSNLCWLTITVVVIAHSCKPSPSDNTNPPQQPAVCPEDDGLFLDASFFLDGIERYKQHQWTASNNDLKINHGTNGDFQDARSCWYSLFRLKKMICLIENNAEKYSIKGEFGIRFYYATYPDATQQAVRTPVGTPPIFINTKADVSWHHTLFMVPTAFDSLLKLDQDIFMLPSPLHNDTGNNREVEKRIWLPAKPDWDMLKKHNGDPQYKILAFGAAIPTPIPSSLNQGMLCPPTCGGGEGTIFNLAAGQKIAQ